MTSILAGLLLLCVLIVVHEFGHFIVAKAFGVKVLTFSVGFGPKLLKWTWRETEYCLCAIPLGGYVKMVGGSPLDELSDEEKKVSYLHQVLWKKSAIAFAGPLFNFILPVVLFWFLFFGNETFTTPVVGTTIAGDVAAVAGVLPGDLIKRVDGVPVETFSDAVREISGKPGQKIKLDIERHVAGKTQQTTLFLTPSAMPDPNPVNQGEFIGRIGIMPMVRRATIAVLNPASAAAIAGLKTFDEIESINSEPVMSFDDLAKKLAMQTKTFSLRVLRKGDAQAKPESINIVLDPNSTKDSAVVSDPNVQRFAVDESEITSTKYLDAFAKTQEILKNYGKSTSDLFGISFADLTIGTVTKDSAAEKVGLSRGDRLLSVNGAPVDSWFQLQRLLQSNPDGWQMFGVIREGKTRVVSLRLKTEKTNDVPGQKVMGALGEDIFKQGATAERYVGAFAALTRGVEKTIDLIKMTGKSLLLLFSFSVPVSQLGGPIMIFDVAGQAASQGLEYYIFVMSLVSVNLGLLNLLPIPVLDGGYLMMFLIEFLTRRPLSLKTRQIATQIGVFFVLAMMSLAIFNDIARLFS